jgi:drug/metabolite transporter (DMT)-like permease
MTGFALALVLASAFVHATWNLLAKKAGGGAVFVWLFAAISMVLYAPIVAVVLIATDPSIGAAEIGFMAGSAVLHVAYFLTLQRGYAVGDLSLVYPLARGTGPLITTAAAIALLDEQPSAVAISGTVLITVGVITLAGNFATAREKRSAVLLALLTGLLIACYTLWDKQAVDTGDVPPILLNWGNDVGRALYLLPVVATRRADIRSLWNSRRREVIGVAALSPIAYFLVLTALTFTPASYIAPAREVGILIGAALGARVLAEADPLRRLIGATMIVAGVIALALG